MASYLEIALRVTGTASLEPSERKPRPSTATKQVANQSHSSRGLVAAKLQSRPSELAPCGSTGCAGCYDVGDGRKIHPPRCGESFFRWRAWIAGEGTRQ
jgi:hypothetical protein